MVAVRLLPTGEIDPSFGAGFGYVVTGPAGSRLGAMAMDRNGDMILGGVRAGNIPFVMRLAADGSRRRRSPRAARWRARPGDHRPRHRGAGKPRGTVSSPSAAARGSVYPAIFTVVRVAHGRARATFGGTGVVSMPLDPGQGRGSAPRPCAAGRASTTSVAGTDLTS